MATDITLLDPARPPAPLAALLRALGGKGKGWTFDRCTAANELRVQQGGVTVAYAVQLANGTVTVRYPQRGKQYNLKGATPQAAAKVLPQWHRAYRADLAKARAKKA